MPKSQPARAVWIEMTWGYTGRMRAGSHSLRGLCGLKSLLTYLFKKFYKVTACEGCVD